LHLGDEALERRYAWTAAASRALATRSCEKKVSADSGGVARSGLWPLAMSSCEKKVGADPGGAVRSRDEVL
jgi:hypothetical protein